MKFKRFLYCSTFLLAGILCSKPASAESWHCMMLNQTEQEALDPTIHIPVYASPATTSQVVGFASASLAVADQPPENGFLLYRFPNGKNAWIAQSNVRDWHALANPDARCSAFIKPNGKPGFRYQ